MSSPAAPDAAPDQRRARLRRARALARAGAPEAAEAHYRELLEQRPDDVDALNGLAQLAMARGQDEAALRHFADSLTLRPGQAATLFNCALLHLRQGRTADALHCLECAIEADPRHARAHHHRGKILRRLRRPDEALAAFRRAIELQPEYPEALNNYGNLLKELGADDDALAMYERALAQRPDFAEAWNNRAKALKDLGRFDEALAGYRRALALTPDYANARSNQALLQLLLGDFEAGWRNYEARWQAAKKHRARHFRQPLWLGGEPIEGRRLLVWAEQGFGDSIQYCRYLPLLAERGARLIFEVQRPLLRLMQELVPTCTLAAQGASELEFDLHCPLMSLPHALGTTLASVPAPAAYLRAPPALVGRWRERLGPATAPRIGLAWSGSPAHNNDRNRSLTLAALSPLLELPFEFHALHKEFRTEDAAALAAQPKLATHHQALDDFADTAALIEQLDLVVSVDTSIAHLAGALGKPLWVLLPWVPDHRWLLERSDSPWYPTARLFRQPSRGDWGTAVHDACAAAQARFVHRALYTT